MTLARRVVAGVVVVLAAAAGAAWSPPPSRAVQLVRTDAIRGYEYWLEEYGITRAWAVTKGAGVTVAVIDTGVDASVPDLAGAVVGGTDVSGLGSANGQRPVGDESGHGTWVASLLAGRGTGPDSGLIGVAPQASLLSVSVGLGASGSSASSDDQIAQAVRWAVDHGADVINMSLTRNTLGWPPSWDEAFSYAFAHDVVVVAAAGNRGSGTNEVGAPATIPGVLAVAGVDRQGEASFDASSQGITIGVSAPSEQLVGANPGGGYVRWAGTSGAAPIVSGVVALVRAAHPGLDAANVINRIIATADPVGTAPSPIYGYGLLDAAAAVTASVPAVTANPLGDLQEWIRLHRRAQPTATPSPAGTPAPLPSATPLPPERFDDAAAVRSLSWTLLTGTGIPIALILGFCALATLGAIAVLRGFRRPSPRE